ncbi:hypothetical protein [Devosia ginsengisoli]|uniref:Uncharacterized protein n=1 Tax=Devosia ginsengisoli TaxID=400770 RepID=A0A5B8LQN7_9HYPH|nr:hypothetical protein [Devosia ginsengisoli]QDZ10558.1 hypothetical protein FPZ08_07215 [Devosia ginsengisoli]
MTKYDGTSKVWEREVKAGEYTRNKVQDLLTKLACTHLTDDEVWLMATGQDTGLTHVRAEAGTLSAGENPHYVAKHFP